MEKTLKPIIEKVHAREILDSRGLPTVEVEITASGHKSISAVPSGASTGEFEALELRDGDTQRFHGKGVLKAVDNVINNFGPALIGKDASNQKEIDDLLINIDGSSNKSTFGANASLGISMACSVVSATFYNKPLYHYLNPNSNIMPVPMINVPTAECMQTKVLTYKKLCYSHMEQKTLNILFKWALKYFIV